MKIYTKTGDNGTTSLFRGGRVPKHDLRVQAYGDIDELNSILGIVTSFLDDTALLKKLQALQAFLFKVGSDLATKTNDLSSVSSQVTEHDVTDLEAWIDEMESQLPPLKAFILPGGTKPASFLHHARTVCRRAERSITQLNEHETINPHVLQYINRLSDLLFVLARYVNHVLGVEDVLWKTE